MNEKWRSRARSGQTYEQSPKYLLTRQADRRGTEIGTDKVAKGGKQRDKEGEGKEVKLIDSQAARQLHVSQLSVCPVPIKRCKQSVSARERERETYIVSVSVGGRVRGMKWFSHPKQNKSSIICKVKTTNGSAQSQDKLNSKYVRHSQQQGQRYTNPRTVGQAGGISAKNM